MQLAHCKGRRIVKSIVALAILLASTAAYGQVMKCVGADGRVEYANFCPSGTTGQTTTISTKTGGAKPTVAPAASDAPAPSASASASAQKSLAEQEAAFKKRQIEQREEQQKAQKLAAEKAQKQQACASAQNYLKTLESGIRLRSRDPKTGDLGYLDDAGRAAETAKARKAVQDHCE
jgi:hypothetical protein